MKDYLITLLFLFYSLILSEQLETAIEADESPFVNPLEKPLDNQSFYSI